MKTWIKSLAWVLMLCMALSMAVACTTEPEEETPGGDQLAPWVDYASQLTLDQSYPEGNYKLTVDVMPVNMEDFQINLSVIDGKWLSGVTSQHLPIGQWTTVSFDVKAAAMRDCNNKIIWLHIQCGNFHGRYIGKAEGSFSNKRQPILEIVAKCCGSSNAKNINAPCPVHTVNDRLQDVSVNVLGGGVEGFHIGGKDFVQYGNRRILRGNVR